MLVGVMFGMVACDGCRKSEHKTAPAAGSDASTSASVRGGPDAFATAARTLRAWGSAGKIFRAVVQYPVDEAERAELGHVLREFDEAERTLTGDAGPTGDALASLLRAVASGVKEGKVDGARLDEGERMLLERSRARHERNVRTLNAMQRNLKAPHRASIVQGIRSAEQKRTPPRLAERGGADAGHLDWERMRLESFIHDLALTPEQRTTVDGSYPPTQVTPSSEGAMSKLEALLSAFEHDGFDANRFDLDDTDPRLGAFFRLARFASKIAPILEPPQREKLAVTLLATTSDTRATSRHRTSDEELGEP